MTTLARIAAFATLSATTLMLTPRADAQPKPGAGNAPIELTLNASFIEALKDRATIADAQLLIDKVHTKPNPPASDGDLHVASRAPASVGLPMVAELMNAGLKPAVVTQLQGLEGDATGIAVSGVWRIWPEHGGLEPQVQGDPFPAATTTNPEHVFEIHPLTRVAGQDVTDTLGPIEQLSFKSGFVYKDAAESFHRYENASFQLQCGKQKDASKLQHTLFLKMIGFNYVDFEIALLEEPSHVVDDGLSVFVDILDPTDHDLLVHKRRVWFVKGSGAYNVATSSHAGDHVHVVGIPRVNLSLVSWRCAHQKDHPEAMQWGLPYELVALGILHDGP